MSRRLFQPNGLKLAACCLICGCGEIPSARQSGEAAYVAISDQSPEGPGTRMILRVDLKDDNAAFLADLYDLAAGHFTDGAWNNFGPDSAYREIVFFSRGRKVVLRSWHPLAEQSPKLVAASYGLTSLGEESRDAFLRKDDQGYVAKRNAFDTIERRLRGHYGG